MNTLEKNLNNAMTDQLTIGWTEFRRGFISLQWERLQIAYDDHKGIPAAERNDWGKVFVKAILDYAYDLWKMRNQALHGNTLQESKQKRVEILHEKIDKLFISIWFFLLWFWIRPQ